MARRGIAHVPEGRGTFTTLSVLDNLRLGAWVQRGTSARDLAHVFEFFPLLYERRDQQAGTLSGGEQQMLALGRAMMARPRLLLLDEPSLGLAPLVVARDLRRAAPHERAGTTIVVVEQNATRALAAAQHAYVLETGRVVLGGDARRPAAERLGATGPTWATDVTNFLQQVVSGLASGGIYGSLALAIVLIHRATGVINFAQGEMATLSAFVCWSLVDHGWAFWPAFGATIVLSFAGGAALQTVVIRPIQRGPLLGDRDPDDRAAARDQRAHDVDLGRRGEAVRRAVLDRAVHVGGVAFSKQDIGVIVDLARRRRARGAALHAHEARARPARRRRSNPAEARLVGIRVGAMLATGWGLAAALGAVAGVMAAPSLFLEPNMMQTVLLYAFAAAVLGGMDSPLGAVVGGLAARRAAQPRRHVRALDRRRASARDRARGDPRRPARAARGPASAASR